MTGLVLREPRAGDIAALTEMANLPGVRAGSLRMPYTMQDWAEARFLKTRAGLTNVLAELEGRAVGLAALRRFEERQSHVGEVYLAVHDAFWGRGIGSALLAAVLDIADNWHGLMRVQLTVVTDNPRAIALYERAGFVAEGRLIGDILCEGVLKDSFAMARLRPAPRRVGDVE